MSTDQGYNGTPAAAMSDPVDQLHDLVSMMIAGVRTAVPVRVVAVTNSGGASPIGRVDIQPLVGQLDGRGRHVPHGTIYGVPYMRIQGGGSAVILDPVVGDIGIAVICDRDISAVKSSKRASPPGSTRKYDLSDAVYLHTILSSAPSQYIRFHAGGIEINAPSVTINGATSINGATAIEGGGLTHNGTNVGSDHVHGGVASGSSTTAGPQ